METTDYTILQQQLKLLSKEFSACSGFILDIDKIVDKESFRSFLDRKMESICERLDIDNFNDLEYQVEELEDELRDARRNQEEAEEKLADLEYKYGLDSNLLIDEFKCEHFLKYKGDYTEMELEELLKNGKELLKNACSIQ